MEGGVNKVTSLLPPPQFESLSLTQLAKVESLYKEGPIQALVVHPRTRYIVTTRHNSFLKRYGWLVSPKSGARSPILISFFFNEVLLFRVDWKLTRPTCVR